MSDPPPDARESALDLLIRWADTCYDPNGVRIYEDAEIDRARAELSALRASQGAVAREKADRLREILSDLIEAVESEARETKRVVAVEVWTECDDGREAIAAYDALRPAATGEAISADDLRDAFIEGWHASSEELDEPYDAKKALAAWGESASKHDARAAIARAEGRKGT